MILIIGHPNAGKTTYSQQYDNVLHLDDFPQSKFLNCNKAVKKSDGNVVVEGIYNLRCRRKLLLEQVKDKDCKNICIWIDTPLEVCIERERNYRHRPEQMVRHSYDAFQPPTYDEGWDEIIRICYNSSEEE